MHFFHCLSISTALFISTAYASSVGKKETTAPRKVDYNYNLKPHNGPKVEFEVARHEPIRSKAYKKVIVPKGDYSPIEQTLVTLNQNNLANLSRTLREQNPYPLGTKQYSIWKEQAELNIPILILSSLYVNDFCSAKQIQTILFSQRDCTHWINIFKALFPNYNSIDFMTSRVGYRRPTPEYVEYVRGLCQGPFIIVDGYGVGGTCLDFFHKYFSFTPIHLAIIRKGSLCPGITYRHITGLEPLNYAPYGTLIGFTKNGPVRANPEYPVTLVTSASSCVALAITLLNTYPPQPFSREAFDALLSALNRHRPAMASYHISRAGANSGA